MNKPKLTQLSGTLNDITRQYVGPLLLPRDTVLAEQGGGDYSIYETLLIDSQVHSCFGQYCDRIIKCETVVEPASESVGDVKIADFVRENIKRLDWDEITRAMLYARIFGYAVSEVLWKYEGDRTWIQDIKVRSQRRFKFDENYKLRLLTLENYYEGTVLPDRKFWTFSMGGTTTDNPYGLGSGHQLYWPVLIKRMGIKSWLKFLDKFAQPFVLVRHADNANEDEVTKALELADSFSEDSSGAASERVQVDLIESQRSGGVNYADICDKMDSAIAKILLSQTMTTDSGSSRSQAQVHDTVAVAAIKSAADLVCSSFNKGPLKWLVEYNFGHGVELPRVWRRTEPDDDLLLQAQVDEKLAAIGYKPSVEYIVETYGEGYRPTEADQDAVIPLSGEQVTALKELVSTAVSDGWTPALAIATVRSSFPTVSDELIQAIGEQLKTQQDEQTKQQEPISTPEAAASLFASGDSALNFAAKKKGKGGKNCEKGKVCKGTCIQKKKTCLDRMSPTQIKNHKKIQAKNRNAAKGGGGAVDDLVNQSIPTAIPNPSPAISIPVADPYNPSLVEKNALGIERFYDGVKQDTTNSRIFAARDLIKDFDKFDPDYQKSWLEGHLMHMEQIALNSTPYSQRAHYEFKKLWDKADPLVREQLAGENQGFGNKSILSLMKPDLENFKVKADEALAKDMAKALARNKPKEPLKENLTSDPFSDLSLSDLRSASPIPAVDPLKKNVEVPTEQALRLRDRWSDSPGILSLLDQAEVMVAPKKSPSEEKADKKLSAQTLQLVEAGKFSFPAVAPFNKAERSVLKKDTLNGDALSTANVDGKRLFVKGNLPLENGWEPWDNISKETMAKQLKSEIATKEIADLAGVGNYYLPVKSYGRGGKEVVAAPMIPGKELARIRPEEKLNLPGSDARKLLALDYALGSLDRHPGNIFVTPSGKPYMIDNGLSFGKATGNRPYSEWANNDNHLAQVVSKGEKLDKSHIQGILDNEAKILAIAVKRNLDAESVKTRIGWLRNAKTWDEIL